MKSALPALALLLAIPHGAQPPSPPYRNPRVSIDARVRDLLARMTREEKFWQLYMAPGDVDDPREPFEHSVFGLQVRIADTTRAAARRHAERVNLVQRHFVERTRLGIPIIPFEEALHGFHGHGATVFPQAIALAATWDTALVREVATAIARETRSRGIRDVLSPVVNIASDVRWGRVEETYGEDPWLTSRMAVAFVEPLERAGIVTTPKHLVANVGDGGRDSYPVHADARSLEEVHFPPFRAAIRDGGARSLMTAYNSVAGQPATQNRWLLTDKVRRDWGFGGFVISDASATGGATVLHMTETSSRDAARTAWLAGLDVVFQGGRREEGPYLDAVRRGLVPDSVLDRSVRRVLHAKFELGLFERPYVDPDSAALWNDHASHRELAARVARASMVLLRNEGNVLPLGAGVRSMAVIGVDAVEARFGGYSGSPNAATTILAGIRARAGSAVDVRYAPGPGRVFTRTTVVPSSHLSPLPGANDTQGLRGEYFDNISLAGTPLLTRTDSRIDFAWTLSAPVRGLPTDWHSARWTGSVVAPEDLRGLGIEGTDGFRLYIDDTLRIDRWRKESAGRHVVPVRWTAGSRHSIRLEYHETRGNARVRLVWDTGTGDEAHSRIAEAVNLARSSDIAVVVAGIEEGEFRDRASLALPGLQEELIRAVAATGKPTVVVIVGGGAVTMTAWSDSVRSIVHAWYPGEEGGRALAEILWGDANPSGRLPITFPIAEGQLPLVYNHRPTGRGDDYLDLTGLPQFAFGFGLSYTSFRYENVRLSSDTIDSSGTLAVTCTVRNAGSRAGDEVVQLYLRDLVATTVRPVIQLGGFRRIHLAPGDSATVTFRIGREQLQMLDANGRWVVEPGTFRILIGSSSRDIRLRRDFSVR